MAIPLAMRAGMQKAARVACPFRENVLPGFFPRAGADKISCWCLTVDKIQVV
ncbi:MAG: hypothetical protein KBA08_06760 [Firmicutes bacterium]|nr:hypothetical protein [Bacillota bacterium]